MTRDRIVLRPIDLADGTKANPGDRVWLVERATGQHEAAIAIGTFNNGNIEPLVDIAGEEVIAPAADYDIVLAAAGSVDWEVARSES